MELDNCGSGDRLTLSVMASGYLAKQHIDSPGEELVPKILGNWQLQQLLHPIFKENLYPG